MLENYESNENSKPAYSTVIPANVRFDVELPNGAKLLYGEINARCDGEGYCSTRNRYFAGLYGCSIRTISLWIGKLVKRGYVSIELDRSRGNRRRIRNNTTWMIELDRSRGNRRRIRIATAWMKEGEPKYPPPPKGKGGG